MKKTLEYIAELSRLELPEEEKADMLEQMQKILDYMDLLNSVDTDATEPLIQFEDLRNVFPRGRGQAFVRPRRIDAQRQEEAGRRISGAQNRGMRGGEQRWNG